jgi:hypothetical protein
MKNVSHDSWSPAQDFNLGSSEHEAGVLKLGCDVQSPELKIHKFS